jgi:hypothetical protein
MAEIPGLSFLVFGCVNSAKRHVTSESWRKKGGKHAQLGEAVRGWTNSYGLRVIADLTQQLYLSMPSYATWLQARRGRAQPDS